MKKDNPFCRMWFRCGTDLAFSYFFEVGIYFFAFFIIPPYLHFIKINFTKKN